MKNNTNIFKYIFEGGNVFIRENILIYGSTTVGGLIVDSAATFYDDTIFDGDTIFYGSTTFNNYVLFNSGVSFEDTSSF